MRFDNALFSAENTATSSTPRYVVSVSFDVANTDLMHLTSHTGTLTPSGDTVIHGVISGIGGTSQSLTPEKALSTIGSIKFDAVDDGGALSAIIRSKLNSGYGLRGMRVRVYMGFDSLTAFSDYVLVQTQIIDSVDHKDGLYSFKCSDIQRSMRKDIFKLAETALSENLTKDATTVPVFNTTGFETLQHGAAYTDAPGLNVGYVIIEGDNDQYEIIRYTGKTSSSFTGCTRGVLGSQQLAFNSTGGSDDAIKVTEYVFLELPAVQLIYALLTGEVFGEGSTLPSSWHLGISTSFVSTPHFQNIGADLWKPSDATAGLVVRFQGLEETDGKQFIEEELLRLCALYMPILADGQLYLKRMTGVLSDAGSSYNLTTANVVSHSALMHDMRAVKNKIGIRWNWSQLFGDFTRRNLLIDADSIATHGEAPLYEMAFKGVHGSRHSGDLIRSLFDIQRDRFAGPALRISAECLPAVNVVEVGDVVRLALPNTEDYSGAGSLDRSFEVQQRTVDWVTGRVSLSLFGSSQAAGALGEDDAAKQGTPLPDSWYISQGTNIESLPGVTNVGGLITITADLDLTGAEDLNSADAVYYADGDLTVATGVTVTISKNFQLRCTGFVTVNGTIDGIGGGHAGALGGTGYEGKGTEDFIDIERGTPGFVGTATAPAHLTEMVFFTDGARNLYNMQGAYGIDGDSIRRSTDTAGIHFGPLPPAREQLAVESLNSSAPALSIGVVGGVLVGMPDDLRGASGSAGYPVRHPLLGKLWLGSGGNGGNGGAGFAIVSRGLGWGVNGKVDLSGGQLTATAVNVQSYPAIGAAATVYTGIGAPGCPGAFYSIIDGAEISVPVLAGKVVGTVSPRPDSVFGAVEVSRAKFYAAPPNEYDVYLVEYPTPAPFFNACGLDDAPVDMSTSMRRAQVLIGETTPVAELDYVPPSVASITLSEILNLPRTVDGNLSTVNVQVTPPADANFAYAVIEYRKKPATNADQNLAVWTTAQSGNTEGSFYTEADGSTYQVRARSIGLYGTESSSYALDEITLSDATNNPAAVLTVPTVTGLSLSGIGGTDYDGHDIAVEWDQNTTAAGGGGVASYFSHYQVQVKTTGGALLRTESVLTPSYTYTLEKNKIDNIGVPLRSVKFEVKQVSRQGAESAAVATITATNPSPSAVTGIVVTPTLSGATFEYAAPIDNDFSGVLIHGSTTNGFTSDASTLIFEGNTNPAVVEGLPNSTTFYYRITSVDGFGSGSQTAQSSFSMAAAVEPGADVTANNTAAAIDGQGALATENTADFATQVGGAAKPADNADVTQDEINAGMAVTVNGGSLYSGKTSYASTLAGWWIGRDAGTGKFHFGNSTKWMKWDGTDLEIVGGLKTATGTGQRVEIDETSNEIKSYADRGDGTVALTSTIGVPVVGSANYFAVFGSTATGYDHSAIGCFSSTGFAGFFNSASNTAISAITTNGNSPCISGWNVGTPSDGAGVFGRSSNGRGVQGQGAVYDFYASGVGTNYGPFTGAHDSVMRGHHIPAPGDIMVDGPLINATNVSNTIHESEPSTAPNTPAIGVFVSSIQTADCFEGIAALEGYAVEKLAAYRYAIVNSVGEGMINVCNANGDIQAGDLIVTSSVPGKGMRQDDDFVRSYTVARAREGVTWSEESGTIKMISCIYLCG